MQRKKTLSLIIIIMTFIFLGVCIFCSYFIWNTNKAIEIEKVQYLNEISGKTAELVSDKIKGNFETLQAVSTFIGSHEDFDLEHSMPILKRESDRNKFKRMGIIIDGIAHITDTHTQEMSHENNLCALDFTDRDYYLKAKQGMDVVSSVLMDKVDNKNINVFATPIYHKNTIVAVLFATQYVQVFNSMLTVQSFGDEGYSYIIDSAGRPIVEVNHYNAFGDFENFYEKIKVLDPKNEDVYKMEQDIADGKNGTISIVVESLESHLSYSKVSYQDWCVISVVPHDAISTQSNKLSRLIAIAVAILVTSLIMAFAYSVIAYRKNNKNLKRLAFTDRITGGANWNKFKVDAEKLLTVNKDVKYAMVIMDIDKFKIINDIFGHMIGNKVLNHIAIVIERNTTDLECFARTSADNFNILMEYDNDSDTSIRLHKILSEIEGFLDNYIIKLSFGINIIDERNTDVNVLSDRANLAKITIKNSVDKNIAYFNGALRENLIIENDLENHMPIALKEKEFQVYFQPKYLFSTLEIIGAEALVRWEHPKRGLLSPDKFIPLFERNGTISRLDKYMLGEVCSIIRKWKNSGSFLGNLSYSVNLSRLSLSNSDLAKELKAIVSSYNLETSQIEIEITESAIFGDLSILIERVQSLADEGFKLSIDDFGSGYSSLNALKDLPTNTIKFDRMFLLDSSNSDKGREIVKSLIIMTNKLGLQSLAEGVETGEQASFLKEIGCQVAQGYYYARPMPIKKLEELIKE